MKKRWIVLLTVLTAGLLTGCGSSKSQQKKWINSTTPTIFVHGYGSSSRAENSMVRAAKRAGVTSTVDHAQVAPNGHVILSGPSIRGKRNPIVQVNLQDNRNTNMAEGARYIYNVVRKLQREDHITSYNVVGHSMGNTDIFAFLNDYGDQAGMPKLKKQVVLAGAGLTDARRDQDLYQQIATHLQKLKNNYPHAKVLNIIGDKGGGTDGRIPNSASRSVKQMLGDRPASYRQVMIYGKNAQHRKLHENPQVFKLINNFLWAK